MPITVTQANNAAMSSESSKAIVLTGVAAGAKLVVLVSQTSSSSPIKTYTVTDNGARTFTLAVINDANTGRQAAIYYYDNHPGGSVTVTVSVDGGGNIIGHVCVVEVAGSGALGDTSFYDNPAVGTTHEAADFTGFNTTAGSIIFACFSLNASADSGWAGPNYTALYVDDLVCHEYRITTTDLTNERPVYEVDRSGRAGPGACCEFLEFTATGGPFPHHTRRLLNGGFI
jgi:hypothetical protein